MDQFRTAVLSRVFVVGYLGDWRRAAAVLFDRESLLGNPPPRRETGQRPAPTLAARTRGGGGLGTDFDLDGGLISLSTGQSGAEIGINHGPTLTCNHEAPIVAHALRAEGFDASEDGTGRGTPIVPVAMPLTAGMAKSASRMPHEQGALIPVEQHYTIEARTMPQAVAFDCKGTQVQHGASGEAPTLRAMGHGESHANAGGQLAVATSYAVRRLNPRECERLQGFSDDFTLIPVGNRLAADGPRYKALGNSMAVNVMEWIGLRIQAVEDMG